MSQRPAGSGRGAAGVGAKCSAALEQRSAGRLVSGVTSNHTTPHLLYTGLYDSFKLAWSVHAGFPCSAGWFAVGEDLDTNSIAVESAVAIPNLNQLMSLFFDSGGGDTRSGWVLSGGQVQPVEDIWLTTDQWLLSLVGT